MIIVTIKLIRSQLAADYLQYGGLTGGLVVKPQIVGKLNEKVVV